MGILSIEAAVAEIKNMIEFSIRMGGVEAKNALIRSQKPIGVLHDATKASFINQGVSPRFIHPPLGANEGELRLAGFFKYKDQDICVLPNNILPYPESLMFDGILKGSRDPYGHYLTERILTVNVRSQLSSIAKNFDTLYERTFAEPLNLHMRCPNMVLGEFYMIPVYEYDDELAKGNIVGFKENRKNQDHIQKYLNAFSAINGSLT